MGSVGETESDSFSYDGRGRLLADSEQFVLDPQHSYSNSGGFGYDLANNLNAGAGWSYNSDNQLTSANSGLGGLPAPTGMGYDASGNLTSLGSATLAYDPVGHLSGYGSTTFTYDFADRRVSKSSGGVTTYFVFDGSLPIAELNSAGQVTAVYTWGSQGLISDRVNMTGTAQSRFYLFDTTGSTRVLLNQNGLGLARGCYTAWGSTYAFSPGTPFGWKGQWGIYSDAESGLMLAGQRYYSPALGRFISPDPTGFEAGPNLYAWCSNDPINMVDPTGASGFSDWYWGGMGGASGWVDQTLMFGTTDNFGFVSGRYDSGKASAGEVIWAGAKFSAALGAAAMQVYGTGQAVFSLGKAGLEALARNIGCFVAGTPVQMADGATPPPSASHVAAPVNRIRGILPTAIKTLLERRCIVHRRAHPGAQRPRRGQAGSQLCPGRTPAESDIRPTVGDFPAFASAQLRARAARYTSRLPGHGIDGPRWTRG